jgi:hypothetical protein
MDENEMGFEMQDMSKLKQPHIIDNDLFNNTLFNEYLHKFKDITKDYSINENYSLDEDYSIDDEDYSLDEEKQQNIKYAIIYLLKRNSIQQIGRIGRINDEFIYITVFLYYYINFVLNSTYTEIRQVIFNYITKLNIRDKRDITKIRNLIDEIYRNDKIWVYNFKNNIKGNYVDYNKNDEKPLEYNNNKYVNGGFYKTKTKRNKSIKKNKRKSRKSRKSRKTKNKRRIIKKSRRKSSK